VDLGALARNLERVRARAGAAEVMLVVKADAYGHGAVPVAWHLLPRGVQMLGVGDSSEALELRASGVTAPIVILGAVVPGEFEDVVRGEIGVTVHSGDRVRALRRLVSGTGMGVGVHLKVDTGMGRLGCHPERALGIGREILRSRGLRLEGLCTHLASAENGRAAAQIQRFRRVLRGFEREGIVPRWIHAHASGSLLADLASGPFNLVRPGLAVYGLDPSEANRDLEAALRWMTQIVFLKDHRRGARIGYGGTWRAPRRVRIATLPVGYNDGYRFSFSNRAHVLVRGLSCPVVGRVSMDYVCVDVTGVPGAAVGDPVTLLGGTGDARVTAHDMARWADTIPYEVLCGIGRRVKRRYLDGSAG
jgi:alanine racemase